MKFDSNSSSNEYLEKYEAVANKYVMRCFAVMMLLLSLMYVLNWIDIFVVDKSLMLKAYVPSMIVYLVVVFTVKFLPMTDRKVKYFILLGVSIVITILGIFTTYHSVLLPVLLFLYATLYSSKPVLRYTYALAVISTIIVVYGGYYYGICDANMVLLTADRMRDYIVNGEFVFNEINSNPYLTLFLFFVIPRCIVYIAFSVICSSLFDVLRGSMQKARFQAELEKKVDEQTEEIRKQQELAKSMFIKTITALSDAVDAKDRYTSGHSKRVAKYSRMIAERLGKTKEEQEEIYRAGLLHDVGKIRVPVDIINKPGRLTEEEFNIMRIHPVTGYHILRGISEDNIIAIAAKHHHERYDGKGYPNGIAGDSIPEVARIIGVADSYDAMSSNRSYRNLLPQHIVRKEIENGKGTQFDPEIADIMLQMIDEDTEYTLKQDDSHLRDILVISGEDNSGDIIKDIMSDETGYKVTFVDKQKKAFDVVAQKYVRLILIDAESIEKEGAKMLNLIKEVYGTPTVIMIDENKLDVTAVVSKYGYDDYLTKPFQPMLVKEIIHNITECMHLDEYDEE